MEALNIHLPNIRDSYKILITLMVDSNYYPEGIRQKLAENMKKARIMHGMSQATVADRIGVTQASVALYESGKSAIPVEVVWWYALNFRANLNEMFDIYSFEFSPELKLPADYLKRLDEARNSAR